jgi:hypothetical protein
LEWRHSDDIKYSGPRRQGHLGQASKVERYSIHSTDSAAAGANAEREKDIQAVVSDIQRILTFHHFIKQLSTADTLKPVVFRPDPAQLQLSFYEQRSNPFRQTQITTALGYQLARSSLHTQSVVSPHGMIDSGNPFLLDIMCAFPSSKTDSEHHTVHADNTAPCIIRSRLLNLPSESLLED